MAVLLVAPVAVLLVAPVAVLLVAPVAPVAVLLVAADEASGLIRRSQSARTRLFAVGKVQRDGIE